MDLLTQARAFLRPPGWRGKTPSPGDLDGAVLFTKSLRAVSFDGAEIAYSIHGSHGPWVVLVPGFVCPDNFWRYLLPDLAEDHRVVVMDHRGLGLSGTPRAPGYRARGLSAKDFAMESLARDIEAILEREEIGSAALIGHSMGGQVILEAYRAFRERISALVMLTAPFGSPLRTFYGRDFHDLFHGLRLAFTLLPRPIVLVWRAALLASPSTNHQLAQITRALGPDAKVEDMASYYRHMAYLDPLVMLMMAEAMRRHSAEDLLPEIDVPTLILTATLDTFTPHVLGERMRSQVADSEHVVIEGASHGAVIEKPDEVNAAIRSFLERRVGPG